MMACAQQLQWSTDKCTALASVTFYKITILKGQWKLIAGPECLLAGRLRAHSWIAILLP